MTLSQAKEHYKKEGYGFIIYYNITEMDEEEIVKVEYINKTDTIGISKFINGKTICDLFFADLQDEERGKFANILKAGQGLTILLIDYRTEIYI